MEYELKLSEVKPVGIDPKGGKIEADGRALRQPGADEQTQFFGLGNWYFPPGTEDPIRAFVELVVANGGTGIRGWAWFTDTRKFVMPFAKIAGEYDVYEINPDFERKVVTLAQECLDNDLILVMTALQGHNGPWDRCVYNPQRNVQGIDGGGEGRVFSDPSPPMWDATVWYLSRLCEMLEPFPNVVMEVKNEGPWSGSYQRRCVNLFRSYGFATMASSSVGGPSSSVMKSETGCDITGPGWRGSGPYTPGVKGWPQFWSEDHNSTLLKSTRAAVVYSIVMQTLCRGGAFDAMDPFVPLEGWIGEPWNAPEGMWNLAARRATGLAHAWWRRLEGYRPDPDESGNGYVLANRNRTGIFTWSWDGERFEIPDMKAGEYLVEEFDPPSGKGRNRAPIQVGGAGVLRFTPPLRSRAYYIRQESANVPFPEEWLKGGNGGPVDPPPSEELGGLAEWIRLARRVAHLTERGASVEQILEDVKGKVREHWEKTNKQRGIKP